MSFHPYFEFDDMSTGYLQLIAALYEYGRPTSPRGQHTLELEDAVFVLKDPTKAFPVGIGRRYSSAIASAEALGLIGGVADPQLMISAGSQFGRFLDGGQLHGTYGPRIRGQLPNVVETLHADPDSRQAILNIWDPRYDMAGWTPRDLPCTLIIAFRVREGRLNCSVTMRSNDIWWGTAHDVPMFTLLQLTVAQALGVGVGSYRHHAFSLHLYDERDAEQIDELHERDDTHRPPWKGVFSEGGIEQGMERARKLLDGQELPMMTPTENFLLESVQPHSQWAKQSRRLVVDKPEHLWEE